LFHKEKKHNYHNMKKFLFFLSILVSLTCKSQISTMKLSQPKEEQKEFIAPYDSLHNISKDNFKQHVGQTLYMTIGSYEKEHGYFVLDLWTNKQVGYNRPLAYQSTYSGSVSYPSLSAGHKYYKVLSYEKDKDSSIRDYYYLKLQETESGDIAYLRFDSQYGTEFMYFKTVGYIIKLKNNNVGKDFIVISDKQFLNKGEKYLEKKGLRSATNGRVMEEIPKGTLLKCVDFTLLEDEDDRMVYVFDSDKYGKMYIPYYESYDFIQGYEEFKKEEADAAKRKKSLISKYGKVNAQTILNGEVKIGFTKAMCREAWGEPDNINTTSNRYGTSEQWVYRDGSYLYFKNGKLTSIQN